MLTLGDQIWRRFCRSLRGEGAEAGAARPDLGRTPVGILGRCCGISASTASRESPASSSSRPPTRLDTATARLRARARRRAKAMRSVLRIACGTTASSKIGGRPAILQFAAHGAARAQSFERAGRQPRQLELAVQRVCAPLGRRSLHAADRDRIWALSVCRHPVVQHAVWARRHPDGPVRLVDRSVDRQGRAALSRGDPIDRVRCPSATPSRARSCTRCATARWRGCGEVPFARYYGSVDATPLFVLLARRIFQSHRGSRDGARAVAECRSRAALDRHLWRPRRRRVCRVPAQERRGVGQSGLEGFARRDLSRGRPDGRRADRAVRGSGLRLWGQAACRERWPWRWTIRSPPLPSRSRPRALREQFEAAFWCEDLSTYALALDGAKQPCRVISSNAGHALLTGIAAPANGRAASPTRCSAPAAFPDGGCARWRGRPRATIRSRTTTARFGRTTTR